MITEHTIVVIAFTVWVGVFGIYNIYLGLLGLGRVSYERSKGKGPCHDTIVGTIWLLIFSVILISIGIILSHNSECIMLYGDYVYEDGMGGSMEECRSDIIHLSMLYCFLLLYRRLGIYAFLRESYVF